MTENQAGCPHGMPTPGSCVDCMDEGLLPPPPRPTPARPEGSSFVARFEGRCSGCSDGIRVGELIVRMDDESYRHERAACL